MSSMCLEISQSKLRPQGLSERPWGQVLLEVDWDVLEGEVKTACLDLGGSSAPVLPPCVERSK